jgi:hypothetical protein
LVLFIPPVFCAVTAAMTGTGKCSLRKRQLECWERQGERRISSAPPMDEGRKGEETELSGHP